MNALSRKDLELWRSYRRTFEHVNNMIEKELVTATGLSAADHGILSRLIEAGTPVVRQRDLCESMRWDRTRLSHHLKRMESRGLVQRSQKCDGTYLSTTEEGRVACGAATPVHAAAVKQYFLKALTGSQKEMLADVSRVLRGE